MKKKKLILLILAILAIILLVGFLAIVRPLVNKTENTDVEPVALLDGEAYYQINGIESNQVPVVFAPFSRYSLSEISVSNGNGFGFTHYLVGGYDYFLMWSDDGSGNHTIYYPEIARKTSSFDYTTLYDETSKIPSLISNAGSIAFKERVYIRANAETPLTDAEYQTVLHRYGLADSDDPVSFVLTELLLDEKGKRVWVDEDNNLYCTDGATSGTRYYDATTLKNSGYDYENTPTVDVTGLTLSAVPGTRTVKIFVGDMLPDETGYYLRLDGRDIVYSTGTTAIGNVVYQNLAYYINPRLVETGESQSSPLFTPSFRIWNGTGENTTGIGKNDNVVFLSESATQDGVSLETSGVLSLGNGNVSDDIIKRLTESGYKVGDTLPLLVGTYPEAFLTVGADLISEYKFYGIGGIVRGDSFLTDASDAVQAGDMVIAAYTVGGTIATGLIDLSDSATPSELSTALIGHTIGESSGTAPFATVSVDYTGFAKTETVKYRVESVLAYALDSSFTTRLIVYNSSEKTKTQTASLPLSAPYGYVLATYSVEIDGVVSVETGFICLDGGNDTYVKDKLATKLLTYIEKDSKTGANTLPLGYLTGGDVSVTLPVDPFSSYIIYKDFQITGVYSSSEEIGIRYVNETERNIFYGGSAYEITSPASRTLYSVNNDNLMDVLQNVFYEAIGTETVAVGLTRENFEKYGLSAHTIRFDMPKGISYRDASSMDIGLSGVLSFNLYVSKRQSSDEGDFYYIASDLYGTVVKASVSDLDFSFVDWEFANEWVDSDMLLLNLSNIRDISFVINYSDLKETHGFAVSVNPDYYPLSTSTDPSEKLYVMYVPGAYPAYTFKTVETKNVETDNRTYTDTVGHYRTTYGTQISQIDENFYEVRTVSNANAVGLDQHYQNQRGGAQLSYSGLNWEGVGNFTKMITLLYTSKYSGRVDPVSLSSGENAKIGDLLAQDSDGKYLVSDEDATSRAVFTIRLTLVDGREYKLTFYPYSDSRYLLSFEDVSSGLVSREFYMNMAEVKNMVIAVRTIVAGGSVTYNQSWLPDVE